MNIPEEFTGSTIVPNLNTNFDIKRHRISETKVESDYRLLSQLKSACLACSICKLGMGYNDIDGISYDPHIFSNLHKSNIIHLKSVPGRIKDSKQIQNDYGVYVTYLTKCTGGSEHNSCKPWLNLELAIIKPKLIIIDEQEVFTYLNLQEFNKQIHKDADMNNYYYVKDPADVKKLRLLLERLSA